MPYQPPVLEKQEYRSPERCTRCGGKCCLIYKSILDGGSYPEGQTWFEDWVEGFHEHPETYGIEPLFDPLDAHMTGHESVKENLLQQGINPDGCQYLGKTGCMIPWDKRPSHCKTYRCDEWLKDESKKKRI